MDRLEHIGGRIRLFRKHQNLTLEELAYIVHKSPSTICKYESGSVNIDILTLSEIADALGIEISQLTDFSKEKPVSLRNTGNFLRRSKRFYVYSLLSQQNDMLLGIMDITGEVPDSNEDNVVLYMSYGDSIDISDPLFIYTGTMTCDDTFAYITLQNVAGSKDRMSILVKSPQWMRNHVKSLALSVSSTYGCPSASVMIFSTEELEITEELIRDLRVDSDMILDFAGKTNIIAPL